MNKRNLTEKTKAKYERIIDEWFINGFNGAAAYRKFYANVKKEATATVNFSKLSSLPEIKEYINTRHKEASGKARLTHEDILDELEAFVMLDVTKVVTLGTYEKKDIRRVVDEDATKELLTRKPNSTRRKFKDEEYTYFEQELRLTDFKDLTEVQRRSIDSVKQGKYGIEIKFFPKEKAFEMLNKHKGFYEADNNQKAASINYESLSVETLMKIWDARNGN
jgi:phage terminase small subunit